MRESQLYGYRSRIRHPTIVLGRDYTARADLRIEHLRTWMERALGKIQFEARSPIAETGDAIRDNVLSVFRSTLAIYEEAMKSAGLGIDTGGRVLRVARKDTPDTVHVTFALCVVDNYPVEYFTRCLRECFEIVTRDFARDPGTREEMEAFLQKVWNDTLQPMNDTGPFRTGTQTVLLLAAKEDVPFRHLGNGIVHLGWGARGRLIDGSECDGDPAIARHICGNKWFTARALNQAGLPGANHIMVQSLEEAERAVEQIGFPLVVKPPHRERSEGVSIDVTDMDKLRSAYEDAAQYGKLVLIEEQVEGLCHRITIAEGRLIYVTRRVPKSVEGDGKTTVRDLVAQRNRENEEAPPWQRFKPWPLDAIALDMLKAQGMTGDSVPAEGLRVDLRSIPSNEWGGWIENVTDAIHPANVELAIAIARLLRMSLAGIDLITTDITRPWWETGAIVNEVNFRPDIRARGREDDAVQVIAALMGGDGRIPVHIVTGQGDLGPAANAIRSRIEGEVPRCFITGARETRDAANAPVVMPQDTLFERAVALLLRPDVEELILVGSEAELLERGLPADRFESVTVAGLEEKPAADLIARLRSHVEIRKAARVA